MRWIQTADADLDPVLLCNDLGPKRDPSSAGAAVIESSGHGSMSVKEAVRIAQSNNLMGLVCRSQLLVSLISLALDLRSLPSIQKASFLGLGHILIKLT